MSKVASMKTKIRVPIFLACLFITSCATSQKTSEEGQQGKVSAEKLEQDKEMDAKEIAKAFDQLDEQMAKMVANAKKEGPQALYQGQ